MTIFEKIIAGELPADFVFQDEKCIAIRDISPQAPTHILIIPKKRIERVMHADDEDAALLGHLLIVSKKIAQNLGFDSFEKGYRLVINNGSDACEEVPHLHIHLLAGRKMTWPPG